MPRIDLPQYEPIYASPQAPRVDPHALDAELAAGRNIANAVANAANTAGTIDHKIRTARENAERDDLELKLRTGMGDFLGELNANHDSNFDTWLTRWDSRMQDIIRDNANDTRLTASGRSELQRMQKNFRLTSFAKINEVRRKKETQIAIDTFRSNLNLDIQAGDEAAATRRIENAVNDKLIFREAGDLEKATLPARIQQQTAWHLINTDPRRAVEMLNAGADGELAAIDERTRATLIGAAGRNISIDNAATLQGIARFVTNGIRDSDPTFNALLSKAAANVPGFTPDIATQLRRKALGIWEKTQPPPDSTGPSTFDIFVDKLHGYDANDPQQREAMLGTLTGINNYQQFQRASRLFDLYDRKTGPASTPNGRLALDALNQAWRDGVFGITKDWSYERDKDGNILYYADEHGKPTEIPVRTVDAAGQYVTDVNRTKYNIALNRYSRVTEIVTQYLADNPASTPEQTMKFIGATIDAAETADGGWYDKSLKPEKPGDFSETAIKKIYRTGLQRFADRQHVPQPETADGHEAEKYKGRAHVANPGAAEPDATATPGRAYGLNANDDYMKGDETQ